MISRANVVLAVLLAIVALLAATSGVDYSQPNIEVLASTSMKYSPAWTTYEENQLYKDGKTLQAPVPGTIARGELPQHFAELPDNENSKDSVPGQELTNPLSLDTLLEVATKEDASRKEEEASRKEQSLPKEDPKEAPKEETPASQEEPAEPPAAAVAERRFQESVNRGAELYQSFCICCHGPSGQGDGMVAQRGYPPPQSFLTGNSRTWNDGQLFYIITRGRLNMPPFAAEVPTPRRWDLINYVRSLQEGAPPVKETAPADETLPEAPSPKERS